MYEKNIIDLLRAKESISYQELVLTYLRLDLGENMAVLPQRFSSTKTNLAECLS